jgi:pimeloyl-ACP methyl ester carboxylesterase
VADASAPLNTLVERFAPTAFDAPGGRARIRLVVTGVGAWDAVVTGGDVTLATAGRRPPDALLEADAETWARIGRDVRGGMAAFRAGRLKVRRNMHLGVGFLAATAKRQPGSLRFGRIRTSLGEMALLEAGSGPPVVMLHGLGATKAEFLPTVRALADRHRMIALDLPGFGDSDKPFPAAYDARFFARWVEAALDALELDQAHVIGHSMGGRVAIEVGLRRPDRVAGLVLMTPSMAWIAERRWANYLRLVRPELALLQPAPRPVVEQIVKRIVPGASNDWVRAALDDFMRAYLTPRGRVAFYAAARHIYLEKPDGPNGFWTRLEALRSDSLFIWGKRDGIVPIGFERHVKRVVPNARHVEVDSGHVPQIESPGPTHAAIASFLHRPRQQRPAGAAAARSQRRAGGA